MGEVIAFRPRIQPEPARKLNPPPPPWRRALIDLWMDEANWRSRPDGGKWFTAPRHQVSIFPVPGIREDNGQEDVWWSFCVWGEVGCDEVWWEPAMAEFAAWEALIEVVKRRMKRRRAKR